MNSPRQRLAAMRETQDGFELAEKDLTLRGPGEMLGTRQTGALQLRFADPVRDAALLPSVRSAARQMMNGSPQSVTRLIERWTGGGERYAAV